MTQTEALRLALEALENAREFFISTQELGIRLGVSAKDVRLGERFIADRAITAIKAALEAKDKLVGWFGYSPAHDAWFHTNEGDDDSIPLYKAPPQRKPLTDDEIEELDMETSGTVHDFVRAIEAAHGIKGEA